METVTVREPPTGEGLTFEKVWAALMEDRERQKETERQMKESSERLDKQIDKVGKHIDKIEKQMGKLGNRFGDLVEHLVAPNLSEKFNEMGFCFTKTGTNVKIKDPEDPEGRAEADIMLENGDIAVVVEVKAKPNIDDVDEHLERMEKLRRYADKRQDKRRYQGAIAGAVMDESVRNYILKKGFYVIEQTGDTVRITVPDGFKAREW